MYKEWNNHLIPYYSFDQFVQKVEKVAVTKQVKVIGYNALVWKACRNWGMVNVCSIYSSLINIVG